MVVGTVAPSWFLPSSVKIMLKTHPCKCLLDLALQCSLCPTFNPCLSIQITQFDYSLAQGLTSCVWFLQESVIVGHTAHTGTLPQFLLTGEYLCPLQSMAT